MSVSGEPTIESRPAVPYVARPETVPMTGLAAAVDRSFPELFGWLGARGLAPSAAPFIRYLRVDMGADLEIELGVPVAIPVEGDDRVRAGALPAGRYVSLVHVGPYDGLLEANAALQRWAAERGLPWAMDGTVWGARYEQYLTDPSQEPDPSRWRTEVSYLLE